MSVMNWDTLTADKDTDGSIRRWLNTSTLDPTETIADAENWLSQRLRVRRMWRRDIVPLVEGASEIDLRTDVPLFLDPISVRVQGSGRLVYVPEDTIDDWRGETRDGELSAAEPCAFTIIGTDMLFDTEADTDYALIVTYYQRPPSLSEAIQTNLYTEHFRVLFKAVMMGIGYTFLKDETRASPYFESAEIHVLKAMQTDDLIRRGQEYDVRVSY